ncbi:DMT family transporter [uncultured Enterovirga sp.]|uniref:DMT family transporter n=1 Tax=uncultured Enterovirga sp. TaxID=2026352 RepID=UPI0035CC2720
MPSFLHRSSHDLAVEAPPDRPLVGIALVLAAGLVFSLADTFSKVLAERLPVVEITWLRWAGFVVVVAPMLVATRGRVLQSGSPQLQAFRAACLIGSSLLFVGALSVLPLASTTTINFVSPLIVTALSIPLLGEKVGFRRWAAVAAGLVGVVVVVRPGSGTFGWAALLPILSATCWAAGVIATRRLGGIDRPWTSMTYTSLIGFVALGLVVPAVFIMPTGFELLLAAGMAGFATAGQFLTVLAFGRAPVSVLAPFTYVMLIWATALGYIVFGTVPDGWTWFGAAIIIASGIYTAHRERLRVRDAARAPVPELSRADRSQA